MPNAAKANALAGAVAALSIDAARAAAWHIVHGWWQALTRGALDLPPCGGKQVALPPGVAAMATSRGADLATRPVTEAVAEIGRLYCTLLPDKHRGSHGVFYTPAPLIDRLLDRAEAAGHDWRTGKVIDPSCGAGGFLLHAAGRMIAALGPADPAIVVAAVAARLSGWDLDPFAAWLAHTGTEALLLAQILASGKRLPPVTSRRDSLAGWQRDAGHYALVMGNPAFGKVKDTAAIRARFRRSLFGHPNLYGLFTDLAVHLAAPDGGIVAYLTPTSFLGGQYFKALRRLLAEAAPPVSIDIVESRDAFFGDVLQEVALSVFRRGAGGPAASCVIHADAKRLRIEAAGSFVLPPGAEQAWLIPRNAADVPLVARMRAMPARLADWGYHVSTGPLVWNRWKASLHDDPRPGSVPVIWAEAVGTDGCFRLKHDKRNHAAFYAPSHAADPNLVRAPCLLLQRTTAKEQSRRLIAAALPADLIGRFGAVAVENHLNMVIAGQPKVPMAILAAFLRSATADRVIRCINASVALSASEIEAMPLPAPRAIIRAMAAKDPEAALRRLYGL